MLETMVGVSVGVSVLNFIFILAHTSVIKDLEERQQRLARLVYDNLTTNIPEIIRKEVRQSLN